MIVDIYYSTVGLLLDIMIITMPILLHFKVKRSARLITYVCLYAITFMLLLLARRGAPLYLVLFAIIAIVFNKTYNTGFKNFFIYALYFIFITVLDIAGSWLPFGYFIMYTTIYKIVLILFVTNKYIYLDEALKEKILSGASISVIIILGIIIGGIYV